MKTYKTAPEIFFPGLYQIVESWKFRLHFGKRVGTFYSVQSAALESRRTT
nr:MAG TPA_asm: hypothetical protein [Caudoviricetes sp.]